MTRLEIGPDDKLGLVLHPSILKEERLLARVLEALGTAGLRRVKMVYASAVVVADEAASPRRQAVPANQNRSRPSPARRVAAAARAKAQRAGAADGKRRGKGRKERGDEL